MKKKTEIGPNYIVSPTPIDKDTLKQVTQILEKNGLTPIQAISIYFQLIIECDGLPFDVRIPSKELLEAFEEIEKGEEDSFNSSDELFKDLGI